MSYPAFSNPYASSTARPAGDAQRQQHITEFISQIKAATPKNQERTVYEVPIIMGNGAKTALTITLPPGFPKDRPGLALSPPVADPWADSTGRLMFDALRLWQHPNSRLIVVAQVALGHLTEPQLPPPGPRTGQPPPPPPPPPLTVPESFPVLQDKSTEDLVKLLTDPEAFSQLLQEELCKAQSTKALEEQKERNVKLAQRNLEMEGKFGEVKNQIAIVRSSEYGATKAQFDDRVSRQMKVAGSLQPEKFIQALEERGAQLEEESEELCSKFMAEDIPVETFVDQYLKLRVEVNERLHRRDAAQVGCLAWSSGPR